MMVPTPSKPHLSTVQPSLPGIKEHAKMTDQENFERGWDSSNPRPETFEQAEAFLRSDDRPDWKDAGIKIKTTMVLQGYTDRLKVVLKADTSNADERQFIQIVELDPPGLSNNKSKVLDLAQEAHTFLRKTVMAEKFGS